MALTSKEQWEAFLQDAGIPETEATTYAETLVANRVSTTTIVDFERQDFTEVAITMIGDVKNILRHAKSIMPTTASATSPATVPDNRGTLTMKAPAAQLPHLDADMTKPQFRKFKMDWEMFKRGTQLPQHQVNAYLYNCCDPHVQSQLVNGATNMITTSEEDLILALEGLVTKKSNPTVHRLQFSSLYQQEKETIKNYVLRLRAASPDCAFSCYSCQADLQSSHIMDQFIRGIGNETLQTDILAKASQLTTLEAVVKHAEGFEAAQRDQSQLHATPEVMAARSSTYQYRKKRIKLKK